MRAYTDGESNGELGMGLWSYLQVGAIGVSFCFARQGAAGLG